MKRRETAIGLRRREGDRRIALKVGKRAVLIAKRRSTRREKAAASFMAKIVGLEIAR
jgi:hypothetical protein